VCEIGKVPVTMSNLFPFPTANKRKDVCSRLLYVILSILLGDDDGSIIEHASHTLECISSVFSFVFPFSLRPKKVSFLSLNRSTIFYI
jgi:hypothetical protein